MPNVYPTEPRQVLARTAYGEARGGDGSPGLADNLRLMQATCNVVMNRLAVSTAHKGRYWWGGTVREICLMPWQFTCWSNFPSYQDPNFPIVLAVTESDPIFRAALDLADEALAGSLPDIVAGATHYKTDATAWPHAWGPNVPPRNVPVARVKPHSFFILP